MQTRTRKVNVATREEFTDPIGARTRTQTRIKQPLPLPPSTQKRKPQPQKPKQPIRIKQQPIPQVESDVEEEPIEEEQLEEEVIQPRARKTVPKTSILSSKDKQQVDASRITQEDIEQEIIKQPVRPGQDMIVKKSSVQRQPEPKRQTLPIQSQRSTDSEEAETETDPKGLLGYIKRTGRKEDPSQEGQGYNDDYDVEEEQQQVSQGNNEEELVHVDELGEGEVEGGEEEGIQVIIIGKGTVKKNTKQDAPEEGVCTFCKPMDLINDDHLDRMNFQLGAYAFAERIGERGISNDQNELNTYGKGIKCISKCVQCIARVRNSTAQCTKVTCVGLPYCTAHLNLLFGMLVISNKHNYDLTNRYNTTYEVYATRDHPEGARLCYVDGEKLDTETFQGRYPDTDVTLLPFVYEKYHGTKMYIDASCMRGMWSLFQISDTAYEEGDTEPNLEIVEEFIEEGEEGEYGFPAVFTTRIIKKGERMKLEERYTLKGTDKGRWIRHATRIKVEKKLARLKSKDKVDRIQLLNDNPTMTVPEEVYRTLGEWNVGLNTQEFMLNAYSGTVGKIVNQQPQAVASRSILESKEKRRLVNHFGQKKYTTADRQGEYMEIEKNRAKYTNRGKCFSGVGENLLDLPLCEDKLEQTKQDQKERVNFRVLEMTNDEIVDQQGQQMLNKAGKPLKLKAGMVRKLNGTNDDIKMAEEVPVQYVQKLRQNRKKKQKPNDGVEPIFIVPNQQQQPQPQHVRFGEEEEEQEQDIPLIDFD